MNSYLCSAPYNTLPPSDSWNEHLQGESLDSISFLRLVWPLVAIQALETFCRHAVRAGPFSLHPSWPIFHLSSISQAPFGVTWWQLLNVRGFISHHGEVYQLPWCVLVTSLLINDYLGVQVAKLGVYCMLAFNIILLSAIWWKKYKSPRRGQLCKMVKGNGTMYAIPKMLNLKGHAPHPRVLGLESWNLVHRSLSSQGTNVSQGPLSSAFHLIFFTL